jgi:glycosyltransferase involved in cell wall biosynthesis
MEPYLLFVGRITRQKGIIHLVNAIKYLDPGFQIVLCAGAPDTQEIAAEMKTAVGAAQRKHSGVIWIEEMVDVKTKIELYSNAAVFVCPSIYEPFGIINLEAMACATPVVATAVGGIKEVVVHGETGYLVSIDQMQESPFEPVAPDRFSRHLAARINELMADPAKRKAFGEAGRRRAEEVFGWPAIAHQTARLFESLVKK